MATKQVYDPTKNLIAVKGGKKYLQVADRLIMANKQREAEGVELTIQSELLHLDPDREFAVVRSTVHYPGHGTGCGIKSCHGLKSRSKADGGFSEYIEKAHTGSVGRALAQIGFGTEDAYEFRLEDAQEGDDLSSAVDTPRPTPPLARTEAPPAQERPANIRDLAAAIPDTRTLAREETQARAADGQVVMERRRDGAVALNNVPLGEDGTAMFEALRKATTLDALGAEWTAVVANRTALSAPQLDILIRWKEQRKVELDQAGVAR